MKHTDKHENLDVLLRSLRLSSFIECREEVNQKAQNQGWSFDRYLHHLAELETIDRERRRIAQLQKRSKLPVEKTLDALELERFPAPVRQKIPNLCDGSFVDKAENVLAFGLPGRGKTHLLCAIGHELIVRRGFQVLFVPTFKLVQRLLVAKRDLTLEAELRKLDRFHAVILDDIGYIQQERNEMDVLFTFLGERYERRSVLITSNLVFSQWNRVFKDSMTTAAAIDRVVHHSTILELTAKRSYRADKAKKKNQADPKQKKKIKRSSK